MRTLLALGWGCVAAAPLVLAASRARAAARALALAGSGPPPRRAASGRPSRPSRAAERALIQEVPLAADLLAMAMGAGLTPYLALHVGAACGPTALAARLRSVLGAVDDGGARLADALDAEVSTSPALAPLVAVLVASERLGAPAGPALLRLAAAGRSRARQEALARARAAPVHLLFPLVFLVLPAFLVLTVAPVLLAGTAR